MKRILKVVSGYVLAMLATWVLTGALFAIGYTAYWPLKAYTMAGAVSAVLSPAVGLVLGAIGALIVSVVAFVVTGGLMYLTEMVSWTLTERLDDFIEFLDDKKDTVMAVLWTVLCPVGTAVWLMFAAKMWPESITVNNTSGALFAGLVISSWMGATFVVFHVREKVFGNFKVVPVKAA
ncbi:MAG TPA: hypothetical protein V6C81_12740 [Planktothrix sp.]|jgi:hypothetical protein